jgi:hypothetical protein
MYLVARKNQNKQQMKKKGSILFRTVAAALALGTIGMPTAQSKQSVNSENIRTIGEANKNAVREEKKKGGEQVAEVDEMSGGLNFNHHTLLTHTSPMYFPKYHPKLTWNQQRQKAKQRKKSK